MDFIYSDQPAYLNIKEERYFIIGKITYNLGFLVHALWILLFYFLEIYELAIFNIFSVLVFSLSIKLNEKSKFMVAITFAYLEVVLHQWLAVYYVGWDTGFQYYIFGIVILPFLTEKPKKTIKFILAFIGIVSFLFLRYRYKGVAPIYQLDDIAAEFFTYDNTITCMVLIAIWSSYFNISVYNAEVALEEEKQRSELLLNNILPKSIVSRLKSENHTIADRYDDVTVLFLDIVGFTKISETVSPK